jgi:hypothetical protein
VHLEITLVDRPGEALDPRELTLTAHSQRVDAKLLRDRFDSRRAGVGIRRPHSNATEQHRRHENGPSEVPKTPSAAQAGRPGGLFRG